MGCRAFTHVAGDWWKKGAKFNRAASIKPKQEFRKALGGGAGSFLGKPFQCQAPADLLVKFPERERHWRSCAQDRQGGLAGRQVGLAFGPFGGLEDSNDTRTQVERPRRTSCRRRDQEPRNLSQLVVQDAGGLRSGKGGSAGNSGI